MAPLLMVNPVSMFAVVFSPPEIVFLTPLLKRQKSLIEFLTLHALRTSITEAARLHYDRASIRPGRRDRPRDATDPRMVDGHRGAPDRGILRRASPSPVGTDPMAGPHPAAVDRGLDHARDPRFFLGRRMRPMGYISSLCWEEWNHLDMDLQRLFILLDYMYDEDSVGAWYRPVCDALGVPPWHPNSG